MGVNQEERTRRHNERWQREVLDGLARAMTVLHDISDGIQQLNRTLSRQQTALPPPPIEMDSGEPMFFSILDLAEHLGV